MLHHGNCGLLKVFFFFLFQIFLHWFLCAAVGLDDVLDWPPADGAAGVGHALEPQSAGVAQAHVAARVDHRVHHVLVADGALVLPRARRRREGGRLGEADGRTGSGSWVESGGEASMKELTEGNC